MSGQNRIRANPLNAENLDLQFMEFPEYVAAASDKHVTDEDATQTAC